jgi:hypothetical protein
MKTAIRVVIIGVMLSAASAAFGQAGQQTLTRDQERARLGEILTKFGQLQNANITFKQSDKNPYNFAGIYKPATLKNIEYLEVIVGVSDNHTFGFRVYPKYRGNYLNAGKALNTVGFMRKLLTFNDLNFMFWGADPSGDIFTGYTFTLESGIPEAAIQVVLWSLSTVDGFVGQTRPFYDGTQPAP